MQDEINPNGQTSSNSVERKESGQSGESDKPHFGEGDDDADLLSG